MLFKRIFLPVLLLSFLIVQAAIPEKKAFADDYITKIPFGSGIGTVIYPDSKYNTFSITLSKSGRVFIRLESNMTNGVVDLTTTDGIHILEGVISNGAKWENAVDLPSGTYYIKIVPESKATISLLVTNSTINDDVEPDNTPDTAQILDLDSGSKVGILTWGDDRDLYKIVVPRDEYIHLEVNSFYNCLPLKIEASDGKVIWEKNFIKTDSLTMIYENIAVTAGTYYLNVYRTPEVDNIGKYYVNVKSCNLVSFNSNGGSSIPEQPVIKDYRVSATNTRPTKDGFTFGGWFTEPEFVNEFDFFNTIITEDITLYAKWIRNPFTVTFNSQGGSDVKSKAANSDGLVSTPTSPKKTGYRFAGWYKEAECKNRWDFYSDIVIEDTTLYAKWMSIYDFDNDGEVSILDIASLAKLYNVKNSQQYWNSRFDVNNDGIIDIYDLAACSKNLTK